MGPTNRGPISSEVAETALGPHYSVGRLHHAEGARTPIAGCCLPVGAFGVLGLPRLSGGLPVQLVEPECFDWLRTGDLTPLPQMLAGGTSMANACLVVAKTARTAAGGSTGKIPNRVSGEPSTLAGLDRIFLFRVWGASSPAYNFYIFSKVSPTGQEMQDKENLEGPALSVTHLPSIRRSVSLWRGLTAGKR